MSEKSFDERLIEMAQATRKHQADKAKEEVTKLAESFTARQQFDFPQTLLYILWAYGEPVTSTKMDEVSEHWMSLGDAFTVTVVRP